MAQQNPLQTLSFSGHPESRVITYGGQAVINILTGEIYSRGPFAFPGSEGYVKINSPSSDSSPIADGVYRVGLGVTQDGTITIQNGRITSIQQAQP